MVAQLNSQTRTLTHDDLRRLTPSVFATQPYHEVSERYCFIPTSAVVEIMQEQGFVPVRAEQSYTRIPGKKGFARHMIRFRDERHLVGGVGDEFGELVLVNAHDRSSAYKVYAGVYRLVCRNGAVIQSGDLGGFSIRHSGNHDLRGQVIDITGRIAEAMPAVMGRIEQWKGIDLTPPQREAFAAAALELRDNKLVEPKQLLEPRRAEDRKTDLWTVSQTVQEHLLRGGDRGRTSTGRRATTRPVKSVNEDLRLNRALWVLTERLAEAVS